MFLDLGREAQHVHDLGDPGPGDPLAVGDLGLAGGVTGFEEGLPLDGLAEEFDDPGRRGLLGRLRLAPRRRDGAHDPVGGHPARQGAHAFVFEGPLGPQGDLDRLFAVGGYVAAVAGVQGHMYDAEPDLGLSDASLAVSRPMHSESSFSWPCHR